jgi:hypothetical protein
MDGIKDTQRKKMDGIKENALICNDHFIAYMVL